jgi:hypothetical protein
MSLAWWLAALAISGAAHAQEHAGTLDAASDAAVPTPGDAPRGMVTIGYQFQHTKGLILDDGEIPASTTTDTHILALAVAYRLGDRWEARVAIPFIRKRSSGGPGAHRPDLLAQPHPESQFLDDGRYHDTWQDWTLGLSYRTAWGRFQAEPHLIATIPSHDYTFFANAAPGQDLRKLKVGVDLSRRLASSNFYYSFGYSYEFVEKVMGIGLNKNHFRLSAGYFFTPRLSGRAFAIARLSQGRDSSHFPPSDRQSESWYQHDRLSRHNYLIAGVGATYQVDDHYSLALTGGTMLWGRTVHDLKYTYELELIRGF